MNEDLEIIWSRFHSELRSFILSRVKNDADSDDILQDIYLKIHENIHNLRTNSRLQSWIYQITRNSIIDYYRNKSREQKVKEIKPGLTLSSGPGKFMEIALNDMIRMMDDLPTEYCEALCLTEIEGMSQKVYAEKIGISYSGAKSRVQRARMMLREMLLKCCHYQFDKYGTVFNIQTKCCCC